MYRSMENIVRLEQELSFAKEELFQSSVELRAMIRAFKEKRLSFAMPSNSELRMCVKSNFPVIH